MTATLESALLLADLEESGLTVRADAAGRLLVTPTAKLNSGQREGIARWKADLLALVAEREASDREAVTGPPPLAAVGWTLAAADAEERATTERIKAGIRRRSPAGSARPAGGGRVVVDGETWEVTWQRLLDVPGPSSERVVLTKEKVP
jgi:hypothetical protein